MLRELSENLEAMAECVILKKPVSVMPRTHNQKRDVCDVIKFYLT